jgi:hypothetical protein
MDAKLTAFEKLHNLRIVGSNIDSYIAKFERLREETGYRKDDLEAIMLRQTALADLLALRTYGLGLCQSHPMHSKIPFMS